MLIFRPSGSSGFSGTSRKPHCAEAVRVVPGKASMQLLNSMVFPSGSAEAFEGNKSTAATNAAVKIVLIKVTVF